MVSSTYLVALVALLGSAVTSAHAHRNAAAEIRSRLNRRLDIGPKGSLTGPAAGCYQLPDSFESPTGEVVVGGESLPAAYGGFMTAGRCADACKLNMKKEVAAVSGTDCKCGSLFPKKSLKVDDDKCDQMCKGYGDVMCKFACPLNPAELLLICVRRIPR